MKKNLKSSLYILTWIFFWAPATGQVSAEKRAGVSVETSNGKWWFSIYPGNIIKAHFKPSNSERNEQVSDAVISKPLSQLPGIKKTHHHTTVSWNEIIVEINNDRILFKPQAETIITLLKTFYSEDKRGFAFSLKPGEMIFGTGERSVPLNRRGYKLPLNNAPAYGYSLNAESLNYSVPFILSDQGYAIFFDNPSRGFLDIGKSDPAMLEYSVTSGELSFYIIPGNNYKDILHAYHSLTGTQPLPPRWAMGNLVSRFGYRDEQQAKGIIEQMKKDSVPMDAIIFDLFWFGDSIKNTLGNLSWVNKKAWPDPEKMIADFKKQNLHTILITEPFVLKNSLNYNQSKAYHATGSSGNPYVLKEFYFGEGGIIDIFRKDAQKWFYKKYRDQMNIGVDGWWGDLGEPENHPSNVYHNLRDLGFKRKFLSGEIHNIYGHYWSKMLYSHFKKDYPDKRLFHLNRSGYAGSPRFSSFPWSGDVSRSWDGLKGQLPLLLGMSVSGIPYIHSDAGGFAGGDGDAELYIRWLQFATFTPIYRPHGTALGSLDSNAKDIPSEASLWPEPTKSLAREAAITRYKWLPYNYNLCYQQTKQGKPLMFPMYFLNKSDSNLYKATDQYMWGDHVMVVPVTEKSQAEKTYYIPAGVWTNMHSFKKYEGPVWVSDSTLTINEIPLFAAEGSFIPLAEKMQSTAEYEAVELNIIYLLSKKTSWYDLYEDDGKNANAIKNNQYEITTFKSSGLNRLTRIDISSNGGKYRNQPSQRSMIITIPNVPARPKNISVNGAAINSNEAWNDQDKMLRIPVLFKHQKKTILISF